MKFLTLAIIMSGLGFVAAQNTKKDAYFDSIYPYKKAVFWSILPGGGQVYNSMHSPNRKNAYWKTPLIYAGLGATTYLIIHNQKLIRSIKSEYELRKTAPPSNPLWLDYDNSALVILYDRYAQLRDFSILGFGAVYLLQMLDAAVEAHFLRFDVSKNLALSFQPYYSGYAMGLNVQLMFPSISKKR